MLLSAWNSTGELGVFPPFKAVVAFCFLSWMGAASLHLCCYRLKENVLPVSVIVFFFEGLDDVVFL